MSRARYPEQGQFAAPTGAAVFHPPQAAAIAADVASLLGLPSHVVERGDGWWVVAGASGAPKLSTLDRSDAFAVAVTPERIELAGVNARALGYAAANLRHEGLSCRRLVDFADLPLRGLHLDLKGPALRQSYLESLVADAAAARISTLLVEYEDRFPYPAELELATDHTVDVAALRTQAARHGITVIPLVQTFGHLEYALRRPRWRHLAEDERRQQLCPMHPEALDFVAATVDAVIAAHPDSEFVHIGGDEPWSLGRCDRCRRVPRGELYIRHMSAVARMVVGHGRRPIIWDDMLYAERDPALADALPPETVVMAWEYAADGPTGWARWGNPQTLVVTSDRLSAAPAGAPLVPLESLPGHERELITAVKADDHPLPWARALVARGRTVFGAAAVRGADGENAAYPRWSKRLANVQMWARHARALGLPGAVGTAWAAYDTVSPPTEPLPSATPILTAAARLWWDTDAEVTLDDWCRVIEHGSVPELEALAESATDPLVRACAEHRLLTLATERLAPVAAWHVGATHDPATGEAPASRTRAIAEDPAAEAARARAIRSVAGLRDRWWEWRQQYADAVRHVYAGDGADRVAAAKATEPLRRLSALLS